MNIYQRMSAITAELSKVAKNLNVNVGRGSYKAVGEADVLAAVKPLEAKYGVYSYPVRRSIVESTVLEKSYNGNVTTQLFMRLEVTYRFVNAEKPEEYVEVTTYGDGLDTGDKAPGKAMTYADKYALLKAYKIITGDDPDQYSSPDGSPTSGKGKNPTNSQTDIPPLESSPVTGKAGERIPPVTDAPVFCEECNKRIADYFNGKELIKAAQRAERSRGMYGRCLCARCARKAGNG